MEAKLVVKIEIRCPACKSRGEIRIQRNLIAESVRGITAVNVAQDLICEHSFVAYIDRNLSVRDSFICDFKVEIPKIALEEPKESKIEKNFDLDIIKLNIVPSLMINIIKCALFGKKVVILSDQDFLSTHYKNFFEYIMEDTFETEIVILQRNIFKKDKKKYKEFIVFDGINVNQDKAKFINSKKSKIESTIVQKFYIDTDIEQSLLFFKNEFEKAFVLGKEVILFNNNLQETQDFTTKRIFEHLLDKYKVKMPHDYLQFIIDITETYFQAKLKKPSSSADFFAFT